MTERSRACVNKPSHVFIPTQATLGYPNRYAKEPAVAEHRQKFVEFSRKLHGALAPLLGDRYSLHEELTVLTSSGFAGPIVRADCVVLTDFGVFVITRVEWSGRLWRGAHPGSWHVLTKTGRTQTHPCPIACVAPAVHFLSALLAGFRCPIEAIAILDNEMSEIGFGVSTSLLSLSELYHFLRVRRERACDRYQYFNFRAMGERLRTGCRLVTGAGAAQPCGRRRIEKQK